MAPIGVQAQDVPSLSGQLTDQTGRLAEDQAEINAALERLFQHAGVRLYVLFVDTTDGLEISDYAREVAELSLTPADALLVVAVVDQSDNLSMGTGAGGALSQEEIERIRSDVLEPRLTLGDLGGGVVSLAGALADALPAASRTPIVVEPEPEPEPEPSGAGGGTGGTGGISATFQAIGMAFVALVLLALGCDGAAERRQPAAVQR